MGISGDGNTAIVGGPGDNKSVGAAWMWGYVFEPPPLLEVAKLVGNDANSTPPGEGAAVAISGDGKTAAAGGPGDYPTQSDSGWSAWGSTWIYRMTNGVWSQDGPKLTVPSASVETANIGGCVGLSADGNTVLMGGFHGFGHGFIFTRTAGVWTEQADLAVTTDSGYSGVPYACALSGDGNTVIEGALEGALYVFAYDGTDWSQQARVAPSDWNGSLSARAFGSAVAVSYDGNTALVGGANDSGNAGAAWVFTRDNTGAWSEQAKLVASDSIGAAYQGTSVALSGDGNTAIAGGPSDNHNFGAAWVYTRSAGVWTQQAKLNAGDGGQGQSVAISADGNTVAVGAVSDNYTAGAVWTYRRMGGVWSQEGAKLVAADTTSGAAQQGAAVSMSADGATIIESGTHDGYDSSYNTYVGAAWVFSSGTPGATHLGVSAPILAGGAVSFPFSVVALDANNALVPAYTGPVRITTTDGAGVVPTGDQPLVNGAASFNATLNNKGTQTITVTDASNSSIRGVSGDIVVTGAPATHFVVTGPNSAARNTPFSFTVAAVSAAGATVSDYAGTVHFTSTDLQASLPADSMLTSGTGTFSATLKTGGSQTITATDTVTAISGVSNAMAVALYSQCDVNQDGVADIRDVQREINQALGMEQATADLNGDGLVSVVEVQMLINAAFGGSCGT